MYLNRLPSLQAQFHGYSQQTRELRLVWQTPIPVPTCVKSKRDDFFFTVGRVEEVENSPLLAVFTMNPNRRINLHDPYGFMLMNAPAATVQDAIVIFQTHISEDDMGCVSVGIPGQEIKIIKGVKAQNPWNLDDARKFTFLINTEIYGLFELAADAARHTAEDLSDIAELLQSVQSRP
jgi:hypothetical protein